MTDILPFLRPGRGRELLAEFFGRPADPSGGGKDVVAVRAPGFPQYRFEWHPQKRIVYLIMVGSKPLIGQAIAHHVETHGQAINTVNTFLRGWRVRDAEGAIVPSLAE
jgi:hypothetical protein